VRGGNERCHSGPECCAVTQDSSPARRLGIGA
jgi:hypothetical protein